VATVGSALGDSDGTPVADAGEGGATEADGLATDKHALARNEVATTKPRAAAAAANEWRIEHLRRLTPWRRMVEPFVATAAASRSISAPSSDG
jgi:hypothetical protein